MLFKHSDANISSLLTVCLVIVVLLPRSFMTNGQLSSNSLENSPISYLHTLVGRQIVLPCDVMPPAQRDTSILVLFYRGENKTPVYSVDLRGKSLSGGIRWSAEYLGARAYFKTTPGESGLVLDDIRLEDSGLYRCRVDFEASPTSNSRIQLNVIEPPQRISVISSLDGDSRTSDVIGPYPEGAEVTLSCQVIGGVPAPKVSWWHEGELLDDLSEVRSGRVTRNSLHLPKLTRSDLLKVITCQAVNTNLTSPLTKTVTIDLAYPPTAIRITSAHDDEADLPTSVSLGTSTKTPLMVTCVSGKRCPLECKVDGSRPPPIVTWKSNERTLESEFQTISSPPGVKRTGTEGPDSSFYSTLMLTADPADNGALISCRATSPALPNQAVEDNVKLNVLYKPRLKLEVKRRIDLKNIEENEDVEFECLVDANPAVAGIQWTRNWIPLIHNVSAGIILSNSGSRALIKKVTNQLSGHYACAAANNRGSGTSNVIELSIKFSPKCSSKQESSTGIGKDESANITCRVDAYPAATMFRWAFNTSDEFLDIPFDQQIEKNDSSNTIMYQPKTPFDFGDLLCWASNSVGTMRHPCVIKVFPIDKPEGVRGCKVSSNSTKPDPVVTVTCLPGWNGGMSQTFTLEVRKAAHVHARVLAALQHSPDPIFHLRNLQPGEEYLLTITSANPRGTSPPVTLTYTSEEEVIAGLTNKHSHPQSSWMKFLPFIAIFIALVVAMTTCASVIACIAKSRAAEKAKTKEEMERKASVESRKTSIQHSLPPDRGKEEIEEEALKETSEHYCAVHGHERRENEYISYKHYFNNMRDDLETQHLLKSSLGGSAGVDNQNNGFNNSNNTTTMSRESSSSCGIDMPSKESLIDYSCGKRFSEGSFRGLAPLASVDSLSGFSTLSNQSSASRKTESSSQKSFRVIPEGLLREEYPKPNGFLPRSMTATLPSIKITPFSSVPEKCPSLHSPPKSPSFEMAHNRTQLPHRDHLYSTSGKSLYHSTPTTTYNPTYNSPSLSQSQTTNKFPTTVGVSTSSSGPRHSSYTTTLIPSLPPPSISTHPMFLNESYKTGQFCREETKPHSWEILNQERKQSRESSV